MGATGRRAVGYLSGGEVEAKPSVEQPEIKFPEPLGSSSKAEY
jgi:hypothetical protein